MGIARDRVETRDGKHVCVLSHVLDTFNPFIQCIAVHSFFDVHFSAPTKSGSCPPHEGCNRDLSESARLPACGAPRVCALAVILASEWRCDVVGWWEFLQYVVNSINWLVN